MAAAAAAIADNADDDAAILISSWSACVWLAERGFNVRYVC